MGDIVSLRLIRKAKKRREREVHADANRVAFGRTKAERAADAATQARIDKTLDSAKRED